MKKEQSLFKGKKHSERMVDKTKDVNHPMYGKHHSEESIKKIKLARAKQVWSDDTNRKRSETQKLWEDDIKDLNIIKFQEIIA